MIKLWWLLISTYRFIAINKTHTNSQPHVNPPPLQSFSQYWQSQLVDSVSLLHSTFTWYNRFGKRFSVILLHLILPPVDGRVTCSKRRLFWQKKEKLSSLYVNKTLGSTVRGGRRYRVRLFCQTVVWLVAVFAASGRHCYLSFVLLSLVSRRWADAHKWSLRRELKPWTARRSH